MADRLTDQGNYLLESHLYRESLNRLNLLNSSRDNYISIALRKDEQTDKLNYRVASEISTLPSYQNMFLTFSKIFDKVRVEK